MDDSRETNDEKASRMRDEEARIDDAVARAERLIFSVGVATDRAAEASNLDEEKKAQYSNILLATAIPLLAAQIQADATADADPSEAIYVLAGATISVGDVKVRAGSDGFEVDVRESAVSDAEKLMELAAGDEDDEESDDEPPAPAPKKGLAPLKQFPGGALGGKT